MPHKTFAPLLLLAATACYSPDGPPAADSGESGSTGEPSPSEFTLIAARQADILFVIDNSGSMGRAQRLLTESLPALVDGLERDGGPESYRLGFTTTDNGNPWCGSTSPEAGRLVASSCRARTGEFVFNGAPPTDATASACTDVCNLDEIEISPSALADGGEARPRPWLEARPGSSNVANGSIAEAAKCVAPQGLAGCGFESPLESMYKALLRSAIEDEDGFGFVRDGAALAIVLVTDEGDCSYATDHQSVFLPESMGGNPSVYWSDPSASAPTSAVCWRAGVMCEGSPDGYDTCYAVDRDEDGNIEVGVEDAVLQPLSRYIDGIGELEARKQERVPGMEVIAMLVGGVPPGYPDGAPMHYAESADPVEQADFGIGAACQTQDDAGSQRATPAVREREFVEAFEVAGRRTAHSICEPGFDGAMTALADAIREQMPVACMPECVADLDPVTDVLDPQCTLTQEFYDPDRGLITTALSSCSPGGTPPSGADACFTMLTRGAMSPQCRDAGWNLEFAIGRRAGVDAPEGEVIHAQCQPSAQREIDCPTLP